jgi:hypothetical protein
MKNADRGLVSEYSSRLLHSCTTSRAVTLLSHRTSVIPLLVLALFLTLGNVRASMALPMQTPVATQPATPVPECRCPEPKIICVNDVSPYCGAGAGACAFPDRCLMYMALGSRECNHFIQGGILYIIQEPPPQTWKDGPLPSLAHNSGSSPAAYGGFVAMADLIKVVSTNTSTTAPTQSSGIPGSSPGSSPMSQWNHQEVIKRCMYEHELKHLCDGPLSNCQAESGALSVQLACLRRYLPSCGNVTVKNSNDCSQLCSYIAQYTADATSNECLCAGKSSKPTLRDPAKEVEKCCDCIDKCSKISLPPECSQWADGLSQKNYCRRKVTPGIAHSCGYYGITAPPVVNGQYYCPALPPRTN